MAKFGRFSAGEKDPVETYEGDILEHVSEQLPGIQAREHARRVRPNRVSDYRVGREFADELECVSVVDGDARVGVVGFHR